MLCLQVDFDGDGLISSRELELASGSEDHQELIAFHDTDRDGRVSAKELVDSWVMFATVSHAQAERKERAEL